MINKDKTKEYAAAVSDAIANLFRDNEEIMSSFHYDLDTIDATAFFTGAIMGLNVLYNQLTGDNKSTLQFTYLANQLIVQDLLKQEEHTK